jgi:hypothetical protein
MIRKILFLVLFGTILTVLTSCSKNAPNTKLYTSLSTATITLEDRMPLYKMMDIHGPILQTLKPGEYKVIESEPADDGEGTWIKVEVKGEKGYILGVVVKR